MLNGCFVTCMRVHSSNHHFVWRGVAPPPVDWGASRRRAQPPTIAAAVAAVSPAAVNLAASAAPASDASTITAAAIAANCHRRRPVSEAAVAPSVWSKEAVLAGWS